MPVPNAASTYERRTFPMLEIKTLDDAAGTFEGYLAVFNNVDQGGDIIQPGAFQKSLTDLQTKQRGRKSRYILPIFWSHLPEEPLGGFTEAVEDDHGLHVKGELDLDIEQGRRAYSGLKRGYLSGMSIGYITVKQGYDQGARVLKELRLLEGSLTAIPMNEEAQVTGVKHDDTIVAPRKTDDGGKGKRSMTVLERERYVRPADHKARDFNTLFQSLANADDLQDEWGDMFIAFTHAMSEVMWQQHAQANGWLGPDAPTVDAAEAVNANLGDFTTALLDLVQRSVAADFVPQLDRDGDQFTDPDGCNADDSEVANSYMSAGTADETKAGRVMSAANHSAMGDSLTAMGKALQAAQAQHKALSDMHTRMAPPDAGDGDDQGSPDDDAAKSVHTETQAGAGDGAAPSGALDGQTTPSGDGNDQLSDAARERLVRLRTEMMMRQLEPQKVGA